MIHMRQCAPWLPGHHVWIYICKPFPLLFFPFFSFSSLALFAFWLRSSVVSVLFSLISEILLRKKSMIKLIFLIQRKMSSGLAYDLFALCPWSHTTAGRCEYICTIHFFSLNLSFFFFISVPQLVWGFEEEIKS